MESSHDLPKQDTTILYMILPHYKFTNNGSAAAEYNMQKQRKQFNNSNRSMVISTSTTSHRSLSSKTSSVKGRSSSSTQDLADIVVAAAQSSRKKSTVSTTIAQLRVSNMKLHGRDDDIELLRSKLRELAKKKDGEEEDAAKNHVGEMILVSGTSGTGKSALIREGLGDHEANHRYGGHTFVSGKFEVKLLKPLSAFSDAMTCLAKCIKVAHNKTGGLSIATLIRDEIQNEFDKEDVEQLQRVLPGWEELLGTTRGSAGGASDSKLGTAKRRVALAFAGKESISQMHYAIRRLLKVVCSHLKGVVLFIDDLQWSDTATLELLKIIVLDGEIPRLLIVGAYREDEVPDHHPLAFHIRELKQMNVSTTEIKVGNLSVDYAIPLVAEALGMDDDDSQVKSLAKTIHRKTEGNTFFMLMFLRSLYDEKLLEYNFGAMKWTWDEDAVNSKIVTENVASVLVNKMNRLQEGTQRMLMIGSCLGATFRLSAVVEVMKKISQAEMRDSMISVSSAATTTESSSSSSILDDSSYASSVQEFEEEGLCEVDDDDYHFAHDQIQSAAFELIRPEQRDSFRGRIGSILLQSLSPQELEDSLFQ
eukprot:scaffold33706_cov227-Skeletonema_dohrnii-CCMP3373.AAC.1